MANTYSLISYPQYFTPTVLGQKTNEIRDAKDLLINGVPTPPTVGDMIVLSEFDPATKKFTGRTAVVIIPYISPYPRPWIAEGTIPMSIRLVAAAPPGGAFDLPPATAHARMG